MQKEWRFRPLYVWGVYGIPAAAILALIWTYAEAGEAYGSDPLYVIRLWGHTAALFVVYSLLLALVAKALGETLTKITLLIVIGAGYVAFIALLRSFFG